MTTATAALTADAIRRRLATALVGRELDVRAEVDSTNGELGRRAREGAPAGTVLIADAQRAGRGRRGQAWFSPGSVNLYVSVLLRPALRPTEIGVFSLIASLAVADAVKDQGVVPAIKWPNDVLVGGKKVAGTLVESALRDDTVEHVILGVGVNLNVDPGTLRARLGQAGRFATSLAAEAGHEIDRAAFAAQYLNRLDAWHGVWETEGPEAVLAAWRDRDILTGRRVEVRGLTSTWEGRVLGMDASCALVVEGPMGRRHALTSEEVRLRD